MRGLVGAMLLFFAFIAESAPKFNALDPSDPLYAQYQAGLCAAAFDGYRQFYSERYWMDHVDTKLDGMTPERREDWVVNYAVTTELRDRFLARYEANCAGAGHVEN
jgi:hypothetical protein